MHFEVGDKVRVLKNDCWAAHPKEYRKLMKDDIVTISRFGTEIEKGLFRSGKDKLYYKLERNTPDSESENYIIKDDVNLVYPGFKIGDTFQFVGEPCQLGYDKIITRKTERGDFENCTIKKGEIFKSLGLVAYLPYTYTDASCWTNFDKIDPMHEFVGVTDNDIPKDKSLVFCIKTPVYNIDDEQLTDDEIRRVAGRTTTQYYVLDHATKMMKHIAEPYTYNLLPLALVRPIFVVNECLPTSSHNCKGLTELPFKVTGPINEILR